MAVKPQFYGNELWAGIEENGPCHLLFLRHDPHPAGPPTGEEGSVARRNLAGKNRGKARVSRLRVFPRRFPQDPSTRRERKSWRNYHTRQATFLTVWTELQTFPAPTALPPGQQTSTSAPLVTNESTAPRRPRHPFHSSPLLSPSPFTFFFLRKAHRSVLSAPLARPGFEMHSNLSTQTAFIAFRVPLRPGFKSYGFFFSLAFLTKEGYFVNYQLVQINKRYFHRKPHFILLKFDYKDGEKGRKSKRKPQMAFPFIAVNELYLCLLKPQPWKSISVGLKNLTKIIGLPFLMQQPLGTGWKDFFMGSPAWIKIMEIRYFIINYSGRQSACHINSYLLVAFNVAVLLDKGPRGLSIELVL